jgi:hypothetical protein
VGQPTGQMTFLRPRTKICDGYDFEKISGGMCKERGCDVGIEGLVKVVGELMTGSGCKENQVLVQHSLPASHSLKHSSPSRHPPPPDSAACFVQLAVCRCKRSLTQPPTARTLGVGVCRVQRRARVCVGARFFSRRAPSLSRVNPSPSPPPAHSLLHLSRAASTLLRLGRNCCRSHGEMKVQFTRPAHRIEICCHLRRPTSVRLFNRSAPQAPL